MGTHDPQVAAKPTAYSRITQFRLPDMLYHWLSEDWCGNDSVPLDHRMFQIGEKKGLETEYWAVVQIMNDAHDIGFGGPHQWHTILKRKEFHQILRWYLRQWIFGEWCGLRRWLWFELLHWRVNRHRQ